MELESRSRSHSTEMTWTFFQALGFYNESVCWSKSSSEQLGKCLSNRSAVHFDTGHFKAAIDDIGLALKNNFPEGKRAKLYLRLIKSFQLLGRTVEAKAALKDAARSNEMTEENLGGTKYREFLEIEKSLENTKANNEKQHLKPPRNEPTLLNTNR